MVAVCPEKNRSLVIAAVPKKTLLSGSTKETMPGGGSSATTLRVTKRTM